MPITDDFIPLLICPVGKSALSRLPEARLAALNRRIAEGSVRHADGRAVETPLEEAIATPDGGTVYRVVDGIPVLLAEDGIKA